MRIDFRALPLVVIVLTGCAGRPGDAPGVVARQALVADSASAAESRRLAEPVQTEAEIHALGEALYQERCASCHEQGRAPSRTQIARNSPGEILEALDTGFMAIVSSFMTPMEKEAVATHLSAAEGS